MSPLFLCADRFVPRCRGVYVFRVSRRRELVVAASAIGGALLFAAAVFVWRVIYDDAPWSLPPFPRMVRWEAFGIYPWLWWAAILIAAVLFTVGMVRRSVRSLVPYLAAFICIATAAVHLPFWYIRAPRIDRIEGKVWEPVRAVQGFLSIAMLVLALSVLLIAITRLRHTPEIVRRSALITTVIVNAGLLHLIWIGIFTPYGVIWLPSERDRPELFIAVRPCRDATIFGLRKERYDEIGTIDDIWLNFADPRNGGAPTFAVSVSGEWTPDYHWLNSSDLYSLRVRRDDPSVVHCDSRPREERVRPAAWHQLGFDW